MELKGSRDLLEFRVSQAFQVSQVFLVYLAYPAFLERLA